jgi:hypothetical protein
VSNWQGFRRRKPILVGRASACCTEVLSSLTNRCPPAWWVQPYLRESLLEASPPDVYQSLCGELRATRVEDGDTSDVRPAALFTYSIDEHECRPRCSLDVFGGHRRLAEAGRDTALRESRALSGGFINLLTDKRFQHLGDTCRKYHSRVLR